MKATHKEIEQMVGMTKVILQPGQFVYGRAKASIDTGLKQSTVEDCMKWLKSNNTIAINPTTKYSVITIINWALYQFQENESDNNPTTKYVNYVSRLSGFPKDQKLDLTQETTLLKIMDAMIKFENGRGLDARTIVKGIRLS